LGFPLLFITIAAIFTIQYFSRRTGRTRYSKIERYIRDEVESNAARKKDIPERMFFRPDISALPVYPDENLGADPALKRRQAYAIERSGRPMLTPQEHKSNRELKREYGAANLDFIARCEENYIQYCLALAHWAQSLKAAGNPDGALAVLGAYMDAASPSSKGYIMTADLLFEKGDKRGLSNLWRNVRDMNVASKIKTLDYIENLIRLIDEPSG
jgi:hypothetical protein